MNRKVSLILIIILPLLLIMWWKYRKDVVKKDKAGLLDGSLSVITNTTEKVKNTIDNMVDAVGLAPMGRAVGSAVDKMTASLGLASVGDAIGATFFGHSHVNPVLAVVEPVPTEAELYAERKTEEYVELKTEILNSDLPETEKTAQLQLARKRHAFDVKLFGR